MNGQAFWNGALSFSVAEGARRGKVLGVFVPMLDLSSLSLPLLLVLFAGAAGAVWLAGIKLSNATDILSARFGLGEALGGLILLAIVTNLPEIAITLSGALSHQLDLAVGNILGGIGVQTVVLVALDVWGVGKSAPLTYRAAALNLVLEGVLVLAVLSVCVMGFELPANFVVGRLEPAGIGIAALWVGGLWLINKARTGLPWHENGQAPDNQNKPSGSSKPKGGKAARSQSGAGNRTLWVFGIGAAVTLVAGVVLQTSGEGIAKHFGMSGVLFGATFLAASTSLPELSTGLAAVKKGDYQLAISDIFGGNAFLPVLFLMASLVSGQAVLPSAHKSDIYLTGLGMLLTGVYITGLIFRPKRQIARMGIDSLCVLIFYVLGIGGLVALARSSHGN